MKIIAQTKPVFYVDLGGFKWSATDLSDTLEAVSSSDVVVDPGLGNKLIELGVLASLGSNRCMSGARKGPNFDTFSDKFHDLYEYAIKATRASYSNTCLASYEKN